MEVIDEEVAKILHAASQSAVDLLQAHRDKFETIARSLVAQEELDEKEIAALIGPPRVCRVHGLPACRPALPDVTSAAKATDLG